MLVENNITAAVSTLNTNCGLYHLPPKKAGLLEKELIPVLGRKQARGAKSIRWDQKAKKHLETTGVTSKDSEANPLGHLLAKDGISEH